MSKIEWFLLICLVILIDLIQLIITLMAVGLVINRVSNIVIGILLPFYLHLRGVNMVDPKKLLAMMGAFTGEEFVIGDFLPLWTCAVAFTYLTYKGEMNPESALGKATKIVRAVDKVTSFKRPLNKDGVRLPSKTGANHVYPDKMDASAGITLKNTNTIRPTPDPQKKSRVDEEIAAAFSQSSRDTI